MDRTASGTTWVGDRRIELCQEEGNLNASLSRFCCTAQQLLVSLFIRPFLFSTTSTISSLLSFFFFKYILCLLLYDPLDHTHPTRLLYIHVSLYLYRYSSSYFLSFFFFFLADMYGQIPWASQSVPFSCDDDVIQSIGEADAFVLYGFLFYFIFSFLSLFTWYRCAGARCRPTIIGRRE